MHTTLDERMALRNASDALEPTAAKLYPDNTYLQAEWIRAVRVVRSTKRGWQLDRPVPRQEQRQ